MDIGVVETCGKHGEIITALKLFVKRNLKEKHLVENVGVDRKMVLQFLFNGLRTETQLKWLWITLRSYRAIGLVLDFIPRLVCGRQKIPQRFGY
jgi:hypothetical protein